MHVSPFLIALLLIPNTPHLPSLFVLYLVVALYDYLALFFIALLT